MKIIFLLIGFIIGVILTLLLKHQREIYGQIDIDPITGLCRFRITSDKLADPRKKYAIFKVSHNAEISRDEQ